jgi:hypothetical protein
MPLLALSHILQNTSHPLFFVLVGRLQLAVIHTIVATKILSVVSEEKEWNIMCNVRSR